MKCEACRQETAERFSIVTNGWRLQVCAGCRDALKRKRGREGTGKKQREGGGK